MEIIDSAPACAPWDSAGTLLRNMRRADLILINGEGTLHHGAELGAGLLSVVDHPARGKTPVALINTIYQENPPEWARWLGKMSLVAARDHRSQREIERADVKAAFAPDLSLYGAAPASAKHRPCVAYGDSIYGDITKVLRKTYKRKRREGRSNLFLPIRTSILHGSPHAPLSLHAWLHAQRYTWDAQFSRLKDPNYRISSNAEDFMRDLQQASIYLTGRYHGICLSIASGVPFRAVASNSFKIEALLEDAGLQPARSSTDVADVLESVPEDWQFTPREQANLSAFLRDGRRSVDALFDRLGELAGG
jgi:polysaccharide pyruvyl transferase